MEVIEIKIKCAECHRDIDYYMELDNNLGAIVIYAEVCERCKEKIQEEAYQDGKEAKISW